MWRDISSQKKVKVGEKRMPNAETRRALKEANEIAAGKRKVKSYKNANAMIREILGKR